MPRTQAADGEHSAFTDHSIPRHRNHSSLSDSLADVKLLPFWPGAGGDRELGIAYAKLASQGKHPELVTQALQLLDGVIAADKDDVEVWLQYGYLQDLRGDEDQAVRWYQRAYFGDPSLIEASVNLGAKYANRGMYPEAIRLWSEVLARNPGLEIVQINLARAYLRTGDNTTARRLLLKALANNPDLTPAQKLLEDPRLVSVPGVELR
jgi:tetratricopeptide (TPR) repeat protein